MNNVAKNIVSALVGAAVYFIVGVLCGMLVSFCSSISVLRDILDWQIGHGIMQIIIVDAFSIFVSFLCASAIAPKDGTKWGLKLLSGLMIAWTIVNLIDCFFNLPVSIGTLILDASSIVMWWMYWTASSVSGSTKKQ